MFNSISQNIKGNNQLHYQLHTDLRHALVRGVSHSRYALYSAPRKGGDDNNNNNNNDDDKCDDDLPFSRKK